jgi:hypothetical protein
VQAPQNLAEALLAYTKQRGHVGGCGGFKFRHCLQRVECTFSKSEAGKFTV